MTDYQIKTLKMLLFERMRHQKSLELIQPLLVQPILELSYIMTLKEIIP